MTQATLGLTWKLKNCMEDIVSESIDEVLDHYPEICRCEVCRLDISALALNSLPARYVVVGSNEVYSKIKMLDSNFRVSVLTSISKAAVIISNNPRHGKENSSGN